MLTLLLLEELASNFVALLASAEAFEWLLGLTTEAFLELSLTFNLTGGLRSGSESLPSSGLILLRGLLNLLLSIVDDDDDKDMAAAAEAVDDNLSNLTSHFLAAVGQTTPPVMIPIIVTVQSYLRSGLYIKFK